MSNTKQNCYYFYFEYFLSKQGQVIIKASSTPPPSPTTKHTHTHRDPGLFWFWFDGTAGSRGRHGCCYGSVHVTNDSVWCRSLLDCRCQIRLAHRYSIYCGLLGFQFHMPFLHAVPYSYFLPFHTASDRSLLRPGSSRRSAS